MCFVTERKQAIEMDRDGEREREREREREGNQALKDIFFDGAVSQRTEPLATCGTFGVFHGC